MRYMIALNDYLPKMAVAASVDYHATIIPAQFGQDK